MPMTGPHHGRIGIAGPVRHRHSPSCHQLRAYVWRLFKHTPPLQPRFGVEVHDVDLRQVTSAHGYPETRNAFETQLLLLFRNQSLDDENTWRSALFSDQSRTARWARRGPGTGRWGCCAGSALHETRQSQGMADARSRQMLCTQRNGQPARRRKNRKPEFTQTALNGGRGREQKAWFLGRPHLAKWLRRVKFLAISAALTPHPRDRLHQEQRIQD